MIMKKKYIAPHCQQISLYVGDCLLTTSNIPVGGTSEDFDSPNGDYYDSNTPWLTPM